MKQVWNKILKAGGAVQGVKELTELNDVGMAHETPAKEVFKTFKELNQLELVNQAGIRQQYIDQSVSLNLAFPSIATNQSGLIRFIMKRGKKVLKPYII